MEKIHTITTDVQRDLKDHIKKVGCLKITFEQGTCQEATLKTLDLENDLIKTSEKTDQRRIDDKLIFA
ncbi:Hypothetical predicted protein [Paramuricea clavata]|uniref:Uncharacterized protein n=1 Tax=Paramuricea clavata TaxID=317549 RepID=A0A6S7KLA5_PARCT|nr:Hypothetical predicted protein [Paramuricea clavata]